MQTAGADNAWSVKSVGKIAIWLAAALGCLALSACGQKESGQQADGPSLAQLLDAVAEQSSFSYVEEGAGSKVHGIAEGGRLAELLGDGQEKRLFAYSGGKELYVARLAHRDTGDDPVRALRLLERGEATLCERSRAGEERKRPGWLGLLRDALADEGGSLELRSSEDGLLRYAGSDGAQVEAHLEGELPVVFRYRPAGEDEPELYVEISYGAQLARADAEALRRHCPKV